MRSKLFPVILPIFLASCGGGIDLSNNDSLGTIDYLGAAAAGEFINFSVDRDKGTYQYEILASQFGQTGTKAEGSITANSDGSYTQGDGAESRLRISPSGLMLGVVTANLFDSNQKTLFFGATDTLTIRDRIAGYYNFISRICVAADSCIAYYGTMEFTTYGTWTLCSKANLAATPKPGWKLVTGLESDCMEYETGTYEANGNSWDLIDTVRTSEFDEGDNPQIIGSAIFKETGSVNSLIIDWRDNRETFPIFEGNGYLVGTSQVNKSFPNTGRTLQYDRYSSDGAHNPLVVQDTGTVTVNGVTYPLEANNPWTGFHSTVIDGNRASIGLTVGDSGVTFGVNPTSNWTHISMRVD